MLCSAVLEERIALSFLQSNRDGNDICQMKLTYCHDCYFDEETYKLEDLTPKKM